MRPNFIEGEKADNLYVAEVYIDQPGTYDYKFVINGQFWITNDCNNLYINERGNHFFEVTQEDFKTNEKVFYNNLNLVRSTFNRYSQKLAVKYRENYMS